MPAIPKPMRPLDRRIRIASTALADAKRCGVHGEIDVWSAKLDALLDQKLDERARMTTKEAAGV